VYRARGRGLVQVGAVGAGVAEDRAQHAVEGRPIEAAVRQAHPLTGECAGRFDCLWWHNGATTFTGENTNQPSYITEGMAVKTNVQIKGCSRRTNI